MYGERWDAHALVKVGGVVGDRHVKEDQPGVKGGHTAVRQLHGLVRLIARGEGDSKEVIWEISWESIASHWGGSMTAHHCMHLTPRYKEPYHHNCFVLCVKHRLILFVF